MTQAVTLFQALADPTRLRILLLLHEMELSVGELAHVLGQSQPRVSRHIKIMDQAGLIVRRKEGNWVFLSLGDRAITAPALAALHAWDREPVPERVADHARLAAVRSVRAMEAEDWFETHATQWDALRSLHVPEADVEADILRLLAPWPTGRLLDIGTGTGRMIELLGGQAENAIGVDRSPSMLRLARSKLDENPAIRVEWRQGDLYALPLPAQTVDTAIMHQVLHYAQHPAAAIAEAARVLAPGGRLLVVDFLTHNRQDLRERAAHAWLGFSDTQMRSWLADAGFEKTRSVELQGALHVMLWLGLRQSP
ncbi:metalloregulator ArsR/SmtB family transcription factor [Acetobacter sp. TBRC 12305]|uniref:Metalloregulator ArsR/SmtB family transcription factor n=1 Tax=Acetobacter garciniae TaxID=2817435 RepID=A0A939HL26_9PROT|nr:metalloregulator ArsR/SmtB family transcription factor [Acetobacter garciniae]MBO1326398.1 metalloregulator ArsR/SmtB family transcription factor [Acetobacter garciniae]MBX0346147.1 metalloregulator ArsR/SmtB family transcription factor [Acetobacter garciniae]